MAKSRTWASLTFCKDCSRVFITLLCASPSFTRSSASTSARRRSVLAQVRCRSASMAPTAPRVSRSTWSISACTAAMSSRNRPSIRRIRSLASRWTLMTSDCASARLCRSCPSNSRTAFASSSSLAASLALKPGAFARSARISSSSWTRRAASAAMRRSNSATWTRDSSSMRSLSSSNSSISVLILESLPPSCTSPSCAAARISAALASPSCLITLSRSLATRSRSR
mmetsp:Transcript_32364/g.82139  ORF Transcript_32364/g.82139 Transcript_32364/m.82139 type:complete len:227 (+) Transcript_32364:309-989(+)